MNLFLWKKLLYLILCPVLIVLWLHNKISRNKFWNRRFNYKIIFKSINIKLIDYYLALLDGLVLAAKIADKYYEFKEQEKLFSIADLYRVERVHYYDNSYNMSYIPERFEGILKSLVRDSQAPAVKFG